MLDLTAQILPRLQANRIPGVDLGDDLIYPAYQGASILNIPSSACRLLGVPEIGAEALLPEILDPVGDEIRRVILIVMDGLAFHRLQRWLADGSAPVWNVLLKEGLLAPLTSITPSTTSAALTSLWTGRSPAEHGILGYEMWLKEYGVVANMITHSPITFRGEFGSLRHAGFNPESFLTLPTLGPHLAAHGVKAYAYQHLSIARSGLSEMLLRGVELRSFRTPADLWVRLRQSIESAPGERAYHWVYWDAVDYFSHHEGPDDERCAAEFTSFSAAFEASFLKRLPLALRQGTLLVLCSDHGEIATQPDPHYDLRSHPGLERRLHIRPSGENRLAFLFIRPGQTEAVREYIERTWMRQFSLMDAAYAAEAGLFGPGEAHPRLPDRMGELVLAAHGPAYLWWHPLDNFLLGRHGGLHPDEMLTPFLAARL